MSARHCTTRCTSPNCGRWAMARGLCNKHYYAARRTGLIPVPPCSIPGCGRPSFHHGWCNRHYRRWANHGDPNALRKKSANGECSGTVCSVCGGVGQRMVNGVVYCYKHAHRVEAHGDPHKVLKLGNGEATPQRKKAQAAVRQRRYLATPHGKLRSAFNQAKRRAMKYGCDWETGLTKDVFLKLNEQEDCSVCGLPLNSDRTLDHIIPLSKGGTNTAGNLQLVHGPCNSSKGNRVPEDTLT